LELSRPECGTVVGIIIPPDVRFAGGSACRKRAHLGSYHTITYAKTLDRRTIM
jgi:hypothetical protein